MVQLRTWHGQLLCPCAHTEPRGQPPRSMIFPKTGTHPASSAAQVFSAPCSGVLALLFHMFSKPWFSAANHERVLHCPKRNRLRWPKSRWLRPRSGLAAWQQVRLLTGCFDLESRGDAALCRPCGWQARKGNIYGPARANDIS